jgi:hypothetical protein
MGAGCKRPGHLRLIIAVSLDSGGAGALETADLVQSGVSK